MKAEDLQQRLSQISTLWTMLARAHGEPRDGATAARQELMHRYSGAVYRYLLGAVRDPEAAMELSQEFALRFLRGAFRGADPARGRFRDYVKTTLVHLVTDYHRARQAWPRPLADDLAGPAAPPDGASSDDFDRSWREDLLERTWQALADSQPTYHAALRLRVENQDLPSPQLAEQLSERLGRPVTADTARKTIQRAHRKFADLLLAEVAGYLGTSDRAALEQELRELDLLKYCRSALERWRGSESE
jgi:RNA polymerase sigma-70 factor (ECF subfamily)